MIIHNQMLGIISKVKKSKTLVNGGLFSIYSFVNQGTSFLLLIILAKFILPDDYGRLSLFNTVVMFVNYFMAFSTSGYMGIPYFKDDRQEFKKTFTSIFNLALFSLSIYLIIAFVLNLIENIDIGFPTFLLFFAAVISFCTCISHMYLDYYRIKEDLKSYGIVSCGNSILNFVLSIFFVISLSQGWVGRVEAQLICTFLFAFVGIIYFFRSKMFVNEWSWERYKKLLFWGIPLIPHLASVWICQGCDRYIINYFYSAYEVGLFSFALNLTSVIIMIGVAFNQTNSVALYKTLSDKCITNKRSYLSRQTRLIFFIYIVATFVVTILVCGIVPYVLPKYVGALPYFVILSVYGFLQSVYFLYCNYLFYYEETKALMYITFGSSILHLLLSLLLTRFSLYNVCSIYILTQLVIVALVYKKSKLLINKNIDI